MDAQQFLAEFGHIANAPGGVARLRELILQLALTGRLVDQRPEDSNVDNALAELSRQRQALLLEQNLPPTRKHKNLEAPEGWFQIPGSWRWEFLGYLSLWPLKDGDWIESKDQDPHGDVRIVQLADVGQGTFKNRSQRNLTSEKAADLGCYFLKQNDVLIARLPDPLGRACVFPGDIKRSVTVVDIAVCRCSSEIVQPKFLMNCINAPSVRKLIESWAVGTTRQRVATGKLGAIPLPVAPIEEQTRIVAKVDELMALCDKLEDDQQKRRKLQNTLRQATLQAVAKAQSPHELQASWARLEANFGRLFSAPEDVDEAIAELKNLAVRGLLAEGIAQDLDIEKIKSDCQALRNEYNASGLMRKQKLVAMAEPETSYPPHWVTAAFDEVAIVIGGVTKGRDLRGRETLICQYLSVANVQRGYFKLDDLKTIQIAKDELEKYKVAKGDLLITEGGDWDKVGRTAIWPGGIDDCLHQNHVFKARVPSDLLLNEWVELVFNSGIGRDYFAGASKQTTNLASINMTQLRSFPLPIPPTSEQRAILSRLSELTQLCVEWRKLLVRRQEMSSLLAQATVASLTGIDLVTEEEAVKVPQTELISRLRLGQAPSIKDQAPLATILARHNGELATQDLWQRSTLEIDAFYAQLKIEVAHGWIEDPSYELDESAPDGPKKYPHGSLVAKVLTKEDA